MDEQSEKRVLRLADAKNTYDDALGAIALIAARRYFNIIFWFVVCLLAAFGSVLLPSTALVIPLLLIFDASIVYAGWRLVIM